MDGAMRWSLVIRRFSQSAPREPGVGSAHGEVRDPRPGPGGAATTRAQGAHMNEIMAIWADWVRPSAGLPTVQWSILLALAAAVGHLVHRHTGVPKVVGYSITGSLAGLAGFSGGVWPLDG